MMSEEELVDNLLKWIQTFDLPTSTNYHNQVSKLEMACDGRWLAEMLHHLDDTAFNAEFLKSIDSSSLTSGSSAVRNVNIRLLIKAIGKYYDDHEHECSIDAWQLDRNSIVNEQSISELYKLLTLIVGIAFMFSLKREEIIQNLPGNDDVQHAIMTALSEANLTETSGTDKFNESLSSCDLSSPRSKVRSSTDGVDKSPHFTVDTILSPSPVKRIETPSLERSSITSIDQSKQIDELQQQVKSLTEKLQLEKIEREHVEKENMRLIGQNATNNTTFYSSTSAVGNVTETLFDTHDTTEITSPDSPVDMKRMKDQMNEDRRLLTEVMAHNDELERERLQLQIQLKDKEAELEDLAGLKDDFRKIKDEYDEILPMKAKCQELTVRNQFLEAKTKELVDLKRDNKVLLDSRDNYMKSAMEADDLRRAKEAQKQRLAACEMSIKDLTAELEEKTTQLNECKDELRNTKKDLNSTSERLRRKETELSIMESVRESMSMHEHLKNSHCETSGLDIMPSLNDSSFVTDVTNDSIVLPTGETDETNDVRERMVVLLERLNNSVLKSDFDKVMTDCRTKQELNEELENSLRNESAKVAELRKRVNDLLEQLKPPPTPDATTSDGYHFTQMAASLSQLETENARLKEENTALQSQLNEIEQKTKSSVDSGLASTSPSPANGLTPDVNSNVTVQNDATETLAQAATVIRALDKQNQNFDAILSKSEGPMNSRREFQSIINDRDEYRRKYEELLDRFANERRNCQQEMQLVATAFQRMAHRVADLHETAGSSTASTLLQRQRDALPQARGRSGNALSNVVFRYLAIVIVVLIVFFHLINWLANSSTPGHHLPPT